MTKCEKCGKRLKIKNTMIQFGKLADEVEWEYCLGCRIFYVSIPEAKIVPV